MGGFQSVPTSSMNVKNTGYKVNNGAKATRRNNRKNNFNIEANDPNQYVNSRSPSPANTVVEVNTLKEVVEEIPPVNAKSNNSMAGGRRRKSRKSHKSRKGRK